MPPRCMAHVMFTLCQCCQCGQLPLLALVESACSNRASSSLACGSGCDVHAAHCPQGHWQGGGRSPLHDRGALQSAAALHSAGRQWRRLPLAAVCPSLPCQLRAPPCHFLPVRLPPSPEHKFRRMPLTQPLLPCPVAVPTATHHAPCLPPLPRSTSSTAFPWWMTTACAWAL